MPANSPYPGESQEQFAMRQKPMNPMAEQVPGSYDQPPMDSPGEGESGIRQAIAQRFPDVLPDKLDEIYQAWQEHSHWAQREGEQPDLEQFFQQYEVDSAPQDETTSNLPPELQERIALGRGQQGPPMGGQYS